MKLVLKLCLVPSHSVSELSDHLSHFGVFVQGFLHFFRFHTRCVVCFKAVYLVIVVDTLKPTNFFNSDGSRGYFTSRITNTRSQPHYTCCTKLQEVLKSPVVLWCSSPIQILAPYTTWFMINSIIVLKVH